MNIALSRTQKRFVDDQVNSGRYVDAGEVVREAVRLLEARHDAAVLLGRGAVGGVAELGDADIMSLAFIVMMEAAKSAREDLKAIMDGVKAINEQKRAWREVQDKVNRDRAANAGLDPEDAELDFSRGLGSEQAYHAVPVPHLDPDAPGGIRRVPTDLHPGPLTRKEDLCTVVAEVKNKLDSLSELGEMESLRLQMAMDRMSKLMSTLSNALKTSADTASAVTQNLK